MRYLRILITGGSGLLGSKIVEIAIKKGHTVYAGYKNHKLKNGIPVQFDVRDKKGLIDTFKMIEPEAVIHAAALTDVDKCEIKQRLAWEINVEGTKNIAELSEERKIFIVYMSTDYVFSGCRGMYEEGDKPNPINHYGFTKFEGEKIIKKTLNLWCVARSSVIFGSMPVSGNLNFVLWIIEKLRRGEPVNIITDQFVSPTLNTNLAEMVLEVLERNLAGTFHLAGATPLDRYSFAQQIAETFKENKSLIRSTTSGEIQWEAKRPKNCSLNVEKASETLRCKPLRIDESLHRLKEEIHGTRAS